MFLIGTMYYNTASIRLCEEMVLMFCLWFGVVVFEMCLKWWEKMLMY